MTDAELKYKSACLEELERLGNAEIPQFFTVVLENKNNPMYKIDVKCHHLHFINDKIRNKAHFIFEKALEKALNEYKEWLRAEIDK